MRTFVECLRHNIQCNWDEGGLFESMTKDDCLKACDTLEQLQAKNKKALEIIEQYGGIEGDHHRCWVIDQVARLLNGDDYERWVTEMKDGVDGPNTYGWDEGIAP